MKRLIYTITALILTIAASAQTLNVKVGNVTYLFPAADAGDMTYTDGSTLTIMGKTFSLSEVSQMTVDNSEVSASSVAVLPRATTWPKRLPIRSAARRLTAVSICRALTRPLSCSTASR